jgi:hypothetical protein
MNIKEIMQPGNVDHPVYGVVTALTDAYVNAEDAFQDVIADDDSDEAMDEAFEEQGVADEKAETVAREALRALVPADEFEEVWDQAKGYALAWSEESFQTT